MSSITATAARSAATRISTPQRTSMTGAYLRGRGRAAQRELRRELGVHDVDQAVGIQLDAAHLAAVGRPHDGVVEEDRRAIREQDLLRGAVVDRPGLDRDRLQSVREHVVEPWVRV